MRPHREAPISPLAYSAFAHVRRHGPVGYLDDAHYKPFLRDDFDYRCVYCLCREAWFPDGASSFSVEHLVPTSQSPAGLTGYDTLVYACNFCNSSRSDRPLPLDPCAGLARHLETQADGAVVGIDLFGAAFADICRLNRPELIRFRRMVQAILALEDSPDPAAVGLCRAYLAYPDDLPDLSLLRPPGGNTRPEGVEQSAFVRRQRGELPATY